MITATMAMIVVVVAAARTTTLGPMIARTPVRKSAGKAGRGTTTANIASVSVPEIGTVIVTATGIVTGTAMMTAAGATEPK